MPDHKQDSSASTLEARVRIEATRARMSETLDAIEASLVRTRQQVRDRFDVLAKIRERPVEAAGVVFGVGLVLGLLTGGGRRDRKRRKAAEERAEHWETRARRLLTIARQQEEEKEQLQALVEAYEDEVPDAAFDEEYYDDEDVEEESRPSRLSAARDVLLQKAEEMAVGSVDTVLRALRERRR